MNRPYCINCGKPMNFEQMNYLCPICGGIYDIPDITLNLDLPPISNSLEQYKSYFGLKPEGKFITLGEGCTPLLQDHYLGKKIFHKMECNNPTGSYKDRGTVVLINYLKEFGHNNIVEDSSGNAGASLSAYAARGGINATIFIPDSASGPKVNQIEAYGASVIKVPGPRQNAADAVKKKADAGAIYASHAYLPMGLLGISTIAFEIFQQLGTAKVCLLAPVGHGGLLLGIMRGFQLLINAHLITQLPYFIGVQAEYCSPIADKFERKVSELVTDNVTIAEGIRVTSPIRGDAILSFLEHNNGMIIRVPESKILPAAHELALRGIHVEPTSAITWAALEQLRSELVDPFVLVQTGAGLKTFLS
jgi:threonine synthase